ncbi:hypothetical protein [Paracoccus laeviglucosivorans]|uniref:Uncharacterized protein n=1 Tax=Paracoccus laeviglucosivorans TaxID=1197861 RepID=A0A521BG73_9RHOB|nr:hypothetical protein [Paracoccus laeviglucosivorans]SMO45720.1 hypothetical protein SAMN06265221_102267 [Paracoccus laeviglucosivorans]
MTHDSVNSVALAAFFLTFPLTSALAAPADPATVAPLMADAYLAMMGQGAAGADPDVIRADMQRLVEAYAPEPLLAEKAPAAFVQAAELAHQGSVPATRGAMYDLARDILLTAAILADQPPESYAPLKLWAEVDPFRADLVPGLGLAESDVQAVDRLRALDDGGVLPSGPARDVAMAAWDKQADQPMNRVLPTRLEAWASGVETAWPDLTPPERETALGVLTRPEIPPAALLEKVIGTEDVIHWLAAVDLPMSKAEREASPELIHFMEMGAFAGPLKAPLMEIAKARASGSTAGMGAAANQLMRLNNWGAMTGEMHSWDSYRYMTQGW